MAKFKCKRSGNIVEFLLQHDIDSMKGHPDYDRIDEEGAVVVDENTDYSIPFKAPVARGRPKKAK